MKNSYTTFESELTVRPDDIDMNNHVHFSRYLDYVLAARYDQMGRCYKMSMNEFIALGFGWVVKSCTIEYKRPLVLGETMLVRTCIDEVKATEARVRFEIIKKESGKISAEGYFDYTLVNLKTGRAEKIPLEVIEKYSI
ncbi:MAG: acyl-CoA thioesterase [Ignavibacteriae bacterium]|nr:acyl-CoA thioesterase [Ignavibacteriota bacterium]